MTAVHHQKSVVIIGAGPAGLSAGYELVRSGHRVVVLEQDPRYVGGLARTVEYRGFRFDIGGHRFFSKNPEIEAMWTEIMGERMRVRARLSRILYRGRFFKYPFEPLDALLNLGLIESFSCLSSYLGVQRRFNAPARSFEDWVVRAFGRRLYEIFFRSYTEKVWGIPCGEISAEWAAQRIRGLSLGSIVRRLMPLPTRGAGVIKTLVDRFRYPPHGPGEVWERVASIVRDGGGAVRMGERVVGVERTARRVTSITTESNAVRNRWRGDHFISTMPLADLVPALDPPAPREVAASARALRFRDFLTVALILDRPNVFPDNWIYIHEPRVRVARIQNFKNWSPDMVPDARFTMLGMEYFCSRGDSMWSSSDEDLISLAADELAALGLAPRDSVVDGTVVRQPKAYPVYDHGYRANVARVRSFLEDAAPNLQVAGRNGMHKYDNQDHAMLTGLMAARNIMGESFDLWRVNSDAEYLEDEPDAASEGGRVQPLPLRPERDALARAPLELAPLPRDN